MAPNKRKILEAARKHTQKGAKDRALKEYFKLLKLDPRDAKLRLEIGDAHRRWGQVEEAITAYTKVAEQYMQEGFEARAVAVFKQIQNLDAERWDSYIPLAELYQRMGLTSEAIQALQTAADGFNRAGKKREALDLLRRMATLDPSNTTSRIKVADLLRQEGMEDEAIAEYEAAYAVLDGQGESEAAGTVLERILEVAPNRVATLVSLGRNLLQRGFGERAEPFAKRALEAEADVPSHYELLADVYRAQQRDAELADTYRRLAELYRRRGDEDSAREIIQRFVPPDELAAPLEPEVGAFGTGLEEGPTLIEEELLDEEIELSDAAPSFDGDLAEETVFGLGDEPAEDSSTAELPRPRDLDAEVDASEPEAQGDPDQLLAEASVYLRYGKRDQALRNLRGVLSRQPDHRGALEKLGEAHADGGETEEAVDAWLRAAEGARAEGDTEAVAVLRDRIAALDEQAAAALGDALPVPEPPADELIELSEDELRGLDAASDSPPEVEHDIGIDIDGVEHDIEIDIDGVEHDIEIDIDAGEPEEKAVAAAEPEAPSLEDAAAEASLSLGASASASLSAQISEDLEEAEFYRQQGLFDEAEPIYRRILEQAPNHPLAQVRLGEIAAQRGEEPGASGSGVAVSADELEDWTDDGLRETDVDLDAPNADEHTVPDLDDDDTGLDLEPAAAEPGSADEESEESGLDADEEEFDVEVDVESEMDPLVDDDAAAELSLDGEAEQPSAVAASEDGGSDGDSFDLAAELSDALDDGESASTGSLGSMSEQDVFAAVFSEFKKGVSKTLNEADHEAHYDLGIAYREMGLLDDALGEFEAAKGSPARRVDSLHMLGLCALDLGRPEAALAHLQEGLDSPDVADDQAMAVRFELGRAYESLGRLDEARGAWEAVAARDPSFCEVEERLASLGEAKPEAEPPAEEDEDLESFEDLFDEDDDEAEPEPQDAAEDTGQHSFEDLIAEANADLDDLEPDAPEEPVADEAEIAPEPEPEPRRRRKKKISFV